MLLSKHVPKARWGHTADEDTNKSERRLGSETSVSVHRVRIRRQHGGRHSGLRKRERVGTIHHLRTRHTVSYGISVGREFRAEGGPVRRRIDLLGTRAIAVDRTRYDGGVGVRPTVLLARRYRTGAVAASQVVVFDRLDQATALAAGDVVNVTDSVGGSRVLHRRRIDEITLRRQGGSRYVPAVSLSVRHAYGGP